MKRVVIVLMFFVFFFSFSAASVEVNNYDFVSSYKPGDNISGKIDLTVADENFNSIISSNNQDEILFSDFLDLNNAGYSCSPQDCSNRYNPSVKESQKTVTIVPSQTYYIGFVLTGNDVEVSGITFSVESNFVKGEEPPVSIDFFERYEWNFEEFLLEYGGKNFGCYDSVGASPGPLIKDSSYCEMIEISATDLVTAGAVVDNNDNKNLRMVLYSEDGTGRKECIYNPLTEEGCVIGTAGGEIIETGKYQVCVEAPVSTTYKIYEETSGKTCGFVYENGPGNSVKDYGIYARTQKYAGADHLSSGDFYFDEISYEADNFIESKYGRNCLNGCVLPLAISGVSQNFKISNLVLDYKVNGESYADNYLYNLESVSALVSFDGVLDLKYTGFSVEEDGEYSLYLNRKKLFSEDVNLLSVPTVVSVSPLNPPAGIPIEFVANVNYDGSKSLLKYEWDFGDGKTEKGSNNSAIHVYSEIKDYNLTIKVSVNDNLSSEKVFKIGVVSPKAAIESTLAEKEKALADFKVSLAGVPGWYKKAYEDKVDLTDLETKLGDIKSEYSSYKNDSGLFGIIDDLYGLEVPEGISAVLEKNVGLSESASEINPNVISEIEGFELSDVDEYKKAILAWQDAKIFSQVSSKKHYIDYSSGKSEEAFRTYSVDLSSSDSEESYLVIGLSSDNLVFKDSVDVTSSEGSSVVTLGADEKKVFEFYSFDSGDILMFVSPKLSNIVLGINVDESCNYNGFCEPEYGEDSKVCRNDCKPTKQIIIYSVLGLFLVLVIYTVLQIWYMRRYEEYLFGDRRHLYNLLMFVTNALARRVSEEEVKKSLKKQGWSSERIRYVIRKALGKKNGLYEIIPVSKITGYFRKRKAMKMQKEMNAQMKSNALNRPAVLKRPLGLPPTPTAQQKINPVIPRRMNPDAGSVNNQQNVNGKSESFRSGNGVTGSKQQDRQNINK
ncbi:MAG: PKD domain-containing protein [archaeon]